MTKNFEKLQRLLEELFQLDQADLDFGIYRIMNQKRDEIVRFLEKDLLPQVKEAFSHYKSADKAQIQKELEKLTQQIESAEMNPDDSPKVKELQEAYNASSLDVTALENEVFSHLFNFFRRYYHEGDFISLRRYKEGVYAIPYEGEEVKLHWANHDQYYVKSSEYFRDYSFILPSGKRVRIHLVAASSEQDNKKEQTGKERRFIICENDPIYEERGELYMRFEYRTATMTDWNEEGRAKELKKKSPKPPKQADLIEQATRTLFASEQFDAWIRELSEHAPTKSNPKRTVLEKHLTQYTARNTLDYFIHKDLGGFLRRELDFYIKNEVMQLDDIEHDTVPRVEQYLSKIKVIRRIAHKIIQFLEQLENFQKKLWLKKKFVVETNYCITLDRVPEELYPEIAANDAQREEWVRLFAIDQIEKDLTGPGYSEPLTTEFLKAHPHLVLDTAFLTTALRQKVLSEIENFDASVDGLLVHSDNWQALSLMATRFRNRINCVYLDPPYNTGNDGFVYKDSYQHSSWMSLMADRLAAMSHLLCDEAVAMVSCDANEMEHLRLILDNTPGLTGFSATLIWKSRNFTDARPTTGVSVDHEYVVVRGASPSARFRGKDKDFTKYTNPDDDPRGPWLSCSLLGKATAEQRPNLHYDFENPETGEVFSPPEETGWICSPDTMQKNIEEKRVLWPKKEGGRPRVKVFRSELKSDVMGFPSIISDVFTSDGTIELRQMFSQQVYVFPKPSAFVRRLVDQGTSNDSFVVDFFAGSGPTAHAVIDQNREDGGNRKYVLVEVADYFDVALKPRVQKAIYSQTWEDSKPKCRSGSSHAFKYIRLESYEDALNNLEMRRTDQQASLLDHDDDLREQYILSYMLDVESRGSQSLLNVESFRNPDQYKLRVERNGETQLVNVDLVETFNWLLGLTVKHIDVIRGVRIVEGRNPDGDRTLVLWRNLDETDNDALDEWFKKQDYNTKDQEYDLIYVNGDNNLENLRRGDQTWKVRLIEEEFGRLMFDVQDV